MEPGDIVDSGVRFNVAGEGDRASFPDPSPSSPRNAQGGHWYDCEGEKSGKKGRIIFLSVVKGDYC